MFTLYPSHNLTGKPDFQIDLTGKDEQGIEYHWAVSSTSPHGFPGRLAYKVDTLIVKKRFFEARDRKPAFLEIGTLRNICRELGINQSCGMKIKRALLQNAGVVITAQLKFQKKDSSKSIKGTFRKYQVFLTDDLLPSNEKASTCYVQLTNAYSELLKEETNEGLAYDFMKPLPCTTQRLYELVNPLIIKSFLKTKELRYPYSSFCLYSGLNRQYHLANMKKQMNNIIQPLQFYDYIEDFYYEPIVNPRSLLRTTPDWWICLSISSKHLFCLLSAVPDKASLSLKEGDLPLF